MTEIQNWPPESEHLIKASLANGTLPSKLYKYRPLSIKSHDDKELLGGIRTEGIIKDSKFWFANPTTFNDPFDCHLSLKGDINAADVDKKLTELGLKETLNKEQIDNLGNDPVTFNNTLKAIADNSTANHGILSLAKKPDNILMWSHYAESHTGVVFELDVEKSLEFFSLPMIVDYEDDYEQLDFINDENESIKRNIRLKSTQWQYEEEVRIFKMKSGNYPIDKQAISKVYFGCRSSSDDVDRMIKLCDSHGFGHLEFYKGETVEGKFELSFSKI